MDRIVYGDEWGEVVDRADLGLIELRWFDTTAAMTKPGFQEWLAIFAAQVEAMRRTRVLIDATGFALGRDNMDSDWRDQNIIPRYNGAGVTKFAFHMPAGMPLIGAPPAPEGPARFPTAYFGTRQSALAWLGA